MITGGFPYFFPQHIINERKTKIPPSKCVFPYHKVIQQLIKAFIINKEPIKKIRKTARKHVTYKKNCISVNKSFKLTDVKNYLRNEEHHFIIFLLFLPKSAVRAFRA